MPKQHGPSDSLTLAAAARKCSVHVSTFRRWVLQGKIPAFATPGGHFRILRKDMDAFIASRMLRQRPGSKGPLRLLVIDDDDDVRETLVDFFGRDARFDVCGAPDGFTGGRLLSEFRPDILILDLVMTGINGFDVCRSVRGSSLTRHIRVVVLTGYASAENFTKARECGADLCLANPVEPRDLREAVLGLVTETAGPARAQGRPEQAPSAE